MRFKRLVAPPGRRFQAILLMALACGYATGVYAQDTNVASANGTRGSLPVAGKTTATKDATEQRWNAHAQTTYVWQRHLPFDAPYTGPQSLSPAAESSYTWTFTAYFGVRLWKGGEFYVDPEAVAGVPFSHLYGLASINNGEIQKNGGPKPRGYRARTFLRQTFELGGKTFHVDDGANQLAGNYQTRRLVVTLGKITQTDIFENNTYANHPRTQFLNWALITYGAWDYAADARAYTIGGAAELYWDDWVIRAGRFMEPKVANGDVLNYDIHRYHGDQVEVQRNYKLGGLDGLVRMLVFRNRTWAGNYLDAIAAARLTGTAPDVTSVRKDASKVGYGISFEQRLGPDIGAFLRFSSANDRIEEYAFTEIDNDVSGGVSIASTRWNRPNDMLGIAYSTAGLNRQHREYLAAGGLGGFLGDGKLTRYGREQALETYYNYQVHKGVQLSPDFQVIVNPGYNADRGGPVYIFGVRIHAEL